MDTDNHRAQVQDRNLADFIQMYLTHEGLHWAASPTTTTFEAPSFEGDWTGSFEDIEAEVEWIYSDPSVDEALSRDGVFA